MSAIIENAILLNVDIKDLEPSPYNSYEISNIEDLKTSIRVGGLGTPLTVIRANDKYQILSGERRYTALKELLKETNDEAYSIVPVYCIEAKLKESEQKFLIDTFNLEARDRLDRNARALSMISALYDMANDPEINVKKKEITKLAAQSLKTSKRYAQMYKVIFESGTEEIKDLVKKNKIKLDIGSQIVKYPTEIQDEAAKAIKEGAKPAEVIDNLRDTKKVEAEIINSDKEDDTFDMEAVMRDLASTSELLISKPKNSINLDTVGKINNQLKEEAKRELEVKQYKSKKAADYIKDLIGSKEFTKADLDLLDICESLINYYENNKSSIKVIEVNNADFNDDKEDFSDNDNVIDNYCEDPEDNF